MLKNNVLHVCKKKKKKKKNVYNNMYLCQRYGKPRDVFSTLSSIYDVAFCENNLLYSNRKTKKKNSRQEL